MLSATGGKMAAQMKEEAVAAGVCQRNLFAGTDGADGRTAEEIVGTFPEKGTRFQVSLRTSPKDVAVPSRVVELCTARIG